LNHFKTMLAIGTLIATASAALGQSRGSFQVIDGYSALTIIENSALSYTVSLGANPMVRVAGIDYAITTCFGMWSLSNDDNFASATGSNFGVWNFHRNSSGSGDIVGWKTNPNSGILPNASETFVYSALSSSQRERFGFHISTAVRVPGQQGLTFFSNGPFIPTPASASLVFGGLLAAARRRRP